MPWEGGTGPDHSSFAQALCQSFRSRQTHLNLKSEHDLNLLSERCRMQILVYLTTMKHQAEQARVAASKLKLRILPSRMGMSYQVHAET